MKTKLTRRARLSLAVALAVIIPACSASQAKVVETKTEDAIVIIRCVEGDLTKGMSPEATAVDCGLRDAAAVLDLFSASKKLAAAPEPKAAP